MVMRLWDKWKLKSGSKKYSIVFESPSVSFLSGFIKLGFWNINVDGIGFITEQGVPWQPRVPTEYAGLLSSVTELSSHRQKSLKNVGEVRAHFVRQVVFLQTRDLGRRKKILEDLFFYKSLTPNLIRRKAQHLPSRVWINKSHVPLQD